MRSAEEIEHTHHYNLFGYIYKKNVHSDSSIFNISFPKMGIESFQSSKFGREATKEALKHYLEGKPTSINSDQRANVEILAQHFGLKVEPMTFMEANQGRGNINYRKGYAYSHNCQSCVVVHEARLRGLNLTALPYSNCPESASFQIAEDSSLPWINKKGNKPNVTKIIGNTDKELYDKLDKQTKVPGRYHIGINLEDDIGHIITAERLISGEIIYYDAQRAEFLKIKEYGNTKSFEVLKVDNLLFNIEVLKAIACPI